MITFNHSGKIGDLLYSLYFCKALAKAAGDDKFNFHIQTYVPETLYGRERDIPRLDDATAEFIASLLRGQKCINEVFISKDFNTKNYQKAVDLDNFRKLHINFSSGIIAEWYYNLVTFPLERHFDEPLIEVEPNNDFKGKVILTQSKKYINPFVDLSVLKEFEDKMVFIGLEDEYELIKKKYGFNIPYHKVNSGLEIAQALKGAAISVSNQNGNYAIAQMIKSNRILIQDHFELVGKNHDTLEQGPTNVVSFGGWFEYANSTQKLQKVLQLIFKK